MATKKNKAQPAKAGVQAVTQGQAKGATKAEKAWQNNMDKLQAAMQLLKRDSDGTVELSSLPITRTITGLENNAQQVKLVKAAIKDANWQKAHGAALTANSHEVVQEEKRLADARLAALEAKKRHADLVAAEKATREYLKTDADASSTHQMYLRSMGPTKPPSEWTVVVPQNPAAAKKAAIRASLDATNAARLRQAADANKKLELAQNKAGASHGMHQKRKDEVKVELEQMETGLAVKQSLLNDKAATGWQNEYQQGLLQPMANSWADEVQQSVDMEKLPKTTKKLNIQAFPKMSQPSKPAVTLTKKQKTKKLNKKAKMGALAALAALAGEAENIIEKEAEHEYIQVTDGALPLRPAFCGDQLGLPIASLYATIDQHIKLQVEAERKEKHRVARENARARQDCIKELSYLFPADATYVQIALVGHKQYPETSLLGLPESIQEQIYRLVLVKDQPIHITLSNNEQPALLRTCQKLRADTLCIFENENDFCIEVVDCQPLVPKNYSTHWTRQVVCKLETSGEPKWANLKKWLKAYHEDGVPGLRDQGKGKSTAWDVCGQAFEMVLSLRELFHDMTFEEMEPMLEVWKKTVELQQVGWTWD